jgi:hypothetical protein
MERPLRHAQRHCFSSNLHDREPEQEKLKAILESKPSAIHLMLGKFFLIRISSVTFSQVYHGPRSSKLWQIQADQIGAGNQEECCLNRLQGKRPPEPVQFH